MKHTRSNHQNYEHADLDKAEKMRRSASEFQKSKEYKNLMLAEKRISDLEILNKNIKRKLTLYNTLQNGSNFTDKSIKNQTQRPQKAPSQTNYESPLKIKQQNKQKFTSYEQNVIENYQNQVQNSRKQSYSNPFEIALVQMIQKEQEMVLKRKKDMEFWKGKVKNLELIYQQLSKGSFNDEDEDI